MEFEEQEVDSATFDDDATEAFDGIAEEIQKEHHCIVGLANKSVLGFRSFSDTAAGKRLD